MVSKGPPANKLVSGTLWLYSYSWYGLQQYKLATIHDGLAVVPLDIDRVKREANPHPDTIAFVVVIQAGEHLWFRTIDIRPEKFWADLPGAIRSLGNSTDLPSGDTQLVLAAPVKRHVTVLHPNGQPWANFDLDVSIYLWDQNHCGVHEGLPLGRLRTDAKGTIEVLAPLLPLYLDGFAYFADAGTGPAGRAYSNDNGMKLSAEEAILVRVASEVPNFTVRLLVLRTNGRPRSGVDVYGNWNTNGCGGADRMAQTDATGIVQLDLDASFTGLTLMIGGPYSAEDPEGVKNRRELSPEELRTLFSTHKLTVRW